MLDLRRLITAPNPGISPEIGAAGIAVVLSSVLLEQFVILRSRIGTGFDYFLADRNTAAMTEAEETVTTSLAPLPIGEQLTVP